MPTMTSHRAAAARLEDLKKLLHVYQPDDVREQGYKKQMLELLSRGEESFERAHYAPGHFTASAFVLNPERTHLLLIHHQKLDRWLQPGGHFEPSDPTVLAAALREVREETGVSNPTLERSGVFDIDIHKIPARKDAPSHLHFDVRLLLLSKHAQFRAGAEVKGADWVKLAEMAQRTSDESVLRAVRKLL